MPDTVTLLDPRNIERNPENPRLIFRPDELAALQQSIAKQGILVPLSVYRDKKGYRLIDGERRWRCAIKLGFTRVPAIVQPKPDQLTNLMMMFAIHNARKDWDPLPTAFKLRDLERLFQERNNKRPTEKELAELASLSTSDVRRLRNILNLPVSYQEELLSELEKPVSQQILKVDHVLEATKAARTVRKRGIIAKEEEDALTRAIVGKFKDGTIKNTVAPRKLARLSRAVERGDVQKSTAEIVIRKLINDPAYSIEDAFLESSAEADFQHTLIQLVERVDQQVIEHKRRRYAISPSLHKSLTRLAASISALLGDG